MVRCLAELAPGFDLRVEEAVEAINRLTILFVSVSIAVKAAEFSSLKSSYAGVHNYCNTLVTNDFKATKFGLQSRCLDEPFTAETHSELRNG